MTEPEHNKFVVPLPPLDQARALARIEPLKALPGALLPILHSLQEEFGFIHEDAVPLIADALNLSRAEVYGVISFYHDFRRTPAGRHRLQMCRAEACQAMGCDRLIEHVEKRLDTKLGHTSEDGAFTLDAVYCLGNCALSPAMMLDGRPYGRVTPQVASFLIDEVQRKSDEVRRKQS
jgi:formate dehydrogenase subunit gamma